MLEQLLDLDTELFVYLNGLGSERWDWLWLIITDKLTFIPLYAVLLFFIYKTYGWKNTLIIVVFIAGLITFTDQLTNVVKRSVLRFRPCACDEIKDYIRFVADYCSTNRSFFSGHASNTMAAAIFGGLMLKPYSKKIIYFLVIWSMIVAYSRIYVGVHFPVDITCGMEFGAFSGFLFYKLYQLFSKRVKVNP